jgi:hypothetical protein
MFLVTKEMMEQIELDKDRDDAIRKRLNVLLEKTIPKQLKERMMAILDITEEEFDTLWPTI